jgi:hypothetical protein
MQAMTTESRRKTHLGIQPGTRIMTHTNKILDNTKIWNILETLLRQSILNETAR